MGQKCYTDYVKMKTQRSPVVKDTVCAFVCGGMICTMAQALHTLLLFWGMKEDAAKPTVSVILIFAAALLTGLGVFDKIAKFAGAGTLVPITGFANAVVSPAIDNKAEGFILGLGAKLFVIAGPVIVFGTLASVAYGFLYWLYGVTV